MMFTIPNLSIQIEVDVAHDGSSNNNISASKGEEGGVGDNGLGNTAAANTTTNHNSNIDKRKKKRLPAKNLTADRRRRKKLNDRLYMQERTRVLSILFSERSL